MKYPFQKEIKVAFISENPTYQFTDHDRLQLHARTDFAWMCSLNALNLKVDETHKNMDGIDADIYIYIPPKNSPALDMIEWVKYKTGKKIGIMQEGPHDFYHSYDIPVQMQYIKMLTEADFILCHNYYDKKYYETFNSNVYIMPTLMIEDTIKNLVKISDNRLMIGGGCSSWYGGTDSFMIAYSMKKRDPNIHLYMPQMGRNNGKESELGISILPHGDWYTWMLNLSTCRYAVHMMPTIAAGTFALNCAYLKIPCIGYNLVDTQDICHPSLSVDPGDLVTARELGHMLLVDKDFYEECSNDCYVKYHEHFGEDRWILKMEETFNKILNK